MSRLLGAPTDVVDQLRRLLPAPAGARTGPASVDRILDAAHDSFSRHGIKATTMTRVARDAGVSREWLYRRYPGRDALLVAVVQREAGRFLDGLAARAAGATDLDGAVTETFVYAIEFLRDHPVLQRVRRTEPDVLTGRLLHDASPILRQAATAGAGSLTALAGVDPQAATVVAETLVRLAVTIVLAPAGALDLQDPETLRAYAAQVVPALLPTR